jgi:5'-nucleotidase
LIAERKRETDMRILITNDDGIEAPGIAALANAASHFGDVSVVAPAAQQSATSHSITLHKPLRIEEIRPGWFTVTGTPTDCVLLAGKGFLDETPRLVLSGINHGPNLGDDVTYSGTVGAAIEGAVLGIPSIAFSLASRGSDGLPGTLPFVRAIIEQMIEVPAPKRTYWNVNFPNLKDGEIRGIAITHIGHRVYQDTVVQKIDPRGKPYYWIGGDEPTSDLEEGSDFRAIHDKLVSLTPLHLDITDENAMAALAKREWNVR